MCLCYAFRLSSTREYAYLCIVIIDSDGVDVGSIKTPQDKKTHTHLTKHFFLSFLYYTLLV